MYSIKDRKAGRLTVFCRKTLVDSLPYSLSLLYHRLLPYIGGAPHLLCIMLLKKICNTPRLLCGSPLGVKEVDEPLADNEGSELVKLYPKLLAPCLENVDGTAFAPDISGLFMEGMAACYVRNCFMCSRHGPYQGGVTFGMPSDVPDMAHTKAVLR